LPRLVPERLRRLPGNRDSKETVGAKAHVYLPLTDSAVPFAGAAIFRQVTLRAKGSDLA